MSAARIHNWKNGEPRYRMASEKRVPDDVTETVGLNFANLPGAIRMYIANKDTGDILEFPHDGVLFMFVNRDIATQMRDDLLNPEEFPDEV